ncbi:Dps family protein [Nocardioides aurantiacus]|uniref:Starvation-inducible DNA-binding protein n=1 Tax=Nocardioides aurantiacus TaxID=86796 RepID=A0A3N2CSS3_9ACTN|nr:DNA starvation/stationary phase protection protein [Nocardioides aurantiacus]ROR90602.1 starvation-inducible DNA-binding protein [Nocardioides aurantiacus]
MPDISYTTPGLDTDQSTRVIDLLQYRLAAYNDLHLTLKHVHWNVVGPNFIAVHEMIDPQVELVRGFADEVAERIATMGGSPGGTTGDIARVRDWDDYALRRDTVAAHLGALDLVYRGVVTSNRDAIAELGDLDPITEDIVIAHTAELEKFQWFVRAHLENAAGEITTTGSASETGAADASR